MVIGSTNTDMVIRTDHLPAPGETIIGENFFMSPGGKGANQAVAAARAGGNVTFITKVGNDVFGNKALALFEKENIDTSHVYVDPVSPSGVALITVDKNGENCIVVASGANGTLGAEDLKNASKSISESSFVLLQLEIPLATIEYVSKLAVEYGIPVILNPAPACALLDSLLRRVSIITPNETEAEMLTGIKVHDIESAEKAALALTRKGVQSVIITMGAKGALILHDGTFTHVPTVKVNAVDTTAAGDVFNGALVVALSEGAPMNEAVSFACRAAAISVTRLGAQASAPFKSEIVEFQNT